MATDPSGRVTGLAIDPSDPSGNTVYAAGASGGIWKTTDFLTTSPAGPTWIPLTDFGPTSGVNIGGIAVFPGNDNPNQSIIIAATGEGDTGTPGVGFLISQDGGATWNLDDSTDNVDASGNLLPIDSTSRNREFVGDTAYEVVVDPKPTPTGGVIIYAALSGPTGGIWRSENTGQTWQLMLSGQATSVVLDPESGTVLNPATGTYVAGQPPGRLRRHPRRGRLHEPQPGPGLEPDARRHRQPADLRHASPRPTPTSTRSTARPPTAPRGGSRWPCPTRPAMPPRTPSIEGWLYAIVATPAGALDGIFVTKDFGQNWTEVNIPTEPNEGYRTNPAIPANDVTPGELSHHRQHPVPAGQLQPGHRRRSRPIPASSTWAAPRTATRPD